MKSAKFLAILIVLAVLFAVPAFAQDVGIRDTCRFEPENPTWTINSLDDTLFSVELWGWTDQVIPAASLGFATATSTGGGLGLDDSLIVADTFNYSLTAQVLNFRNSSVDPDYSADDHWGYNGFLLGFLNVFPQTSLFPAFTPTKIGDFQLKCLDPTLASCEFDIVIDSAFFPPAGTFKFSPAGGGTGFAPEYVGATIHVVNNMCSPAEEPTIGLDPSSFTFNAVEGGSNPPSQTLNITNTGSGTLNWNALDGDITWLNLAPTSGTGDGSTVLTVDITGLSAGTYNATVTVTDPAATNDPQTVPVTLNIAEPPPVIVLDPTTIVFNAVEGGSNPDDDTVWISNGGGGTLNWTAGDDALWLTESPVTGTGNGFTVLSVDISGLAVGTYGTSLWVTDPAASNDPQMVNVTLNITCSPAEIDVLPKNFTFNATEGGSNPGMQMLSIDKIGSCELNWSATNSEVWLSLSGVNGTAPSEVDVSVSIAGLSAGIYEDTIVITHDGTNASPVRVPVVLNIECAPAILETSPASFAFDAQQGGANPTPQILHITNGGTCDLFWGASNSQPWLTLSDYSGTNAFDVDVMVDVTGMTAGEYYDTIIVSEVEKQPEEMVADTIPVVLTIGTEPLLMIAPSELSFTATEGGADPDPQDVAITSTASPDTELDWVVIDGGSHAFAWLGYDPSFGTTPSVMTVTASVAGLAAGVYNDSIMITMNVPGKDAIGDTVVVHVELTVTGVPEIDLTPNFFFFTYEEGGPAPDDQDMNITNVGSGTLNWTAYDTETTGWLDMSTMSGTAPSVVTLSIDIDPSMTAGDLYVDTIWVESADAINSPQMAIVHLEVTEPPVLEGDTVWVGNTSGFPGDQVVVPVTFSNSEDLSGISLPLTFEGSLKGIDNGITCDSVSFIGSRVEYVSTKPVTIDNLLQTVLTGVIVIDEPLIPVGKGLMANLYFSIDPTASAKVVPIDSLFIPPANELMYADADGFAIYPEFFLGTIEILEVQEACLDVNENSFTFNAIQGGPNPNDQYLEVIDCGDADFDWDAWTHVGTWLSIAPTSGINDGTITLSVDITGLVEGDYIDSITVDAGDANGSPQYVQVDLHVGPPIYKGIAGVVQDPADTPIAGATVELWDVFPSGTILETATSAGDGSFEFLGYDPGDYMLHAYKGGYYPASLSVTAPIGDAVIVLTPTGNLAPTNEWVNLYCDEAMFEDYPILPGDVVEAYDPDGNLCGQYFVTELGKYGFMPVYRDDEYTPGLDEGCDPGDQITVKLNGHDMTPYLGAPVYWTQNGDNFEACFDGYIIREICMDLCEGWNLISWNVDTEDDDIEVVMAPIMDYVEVVLGFEQGALTYDPDYPEFSTLETVDHYHGYWVKMTDAMEFCVSGLPVDPSTPISLEEGWNLASYLPTGVMMTEDALVSIMDVLVVALGFDCEEGGMVYDPENPGLSDLTHLSPTYGYWYKVTSDIMLTYPGAPVAASYSGTPDKPSAKLAVLKDVTPTTQWVDVFGGNVTVDGRALEAGSVVEAVDEHGTICGAFEVKASGKLGFMAVYGDDNTTSDRFEGPTTGGTFHLVVDGVATEESFEWTGHGGRVEVGALNSLGGGNVTLPDAFVLKQNYPNPFNPSTSISFSVGKDAHVSLVVYNLLGNVVNVLVDEYRAAGDYTVEWNGSDLSGRTVSSGVYFYKLTSDDYTMTKKMMLMK